MSCNIFPLTGPESITSNITLCPSATNLESCAKVFKDKTLSQAEVFSRNLSILLSGVYFDNLFANMFTALYNSSSSPCCFILLKFNPLGKPIHNSSGSCPKSVVSFIIFTLLPLSFQLFFKCLGGNLMSSSAITR